MKLFEWQFLRQGDSDTVQHRVAAGKDRDLPLSPVLLLYLCDCGRHRGRPRNPRWMADFRRYIREMAGTAVDHLGRFDGVLGLRIKPVPAVFADADNRQPAVQQSSAMG